MPANLNQVTLAGNVGKIDQFTTAGGMMIATVGLAVTKYKKVENGFEDSTNWFTIKIFGMAAERFLNNNSVGDNILICGELDTNSYESDGVKKYNTYITASKVQTCKYGKNNPKANSQGSQTSIPAGDSFNMKYKGNVDETDASWDNDPF